ncbi:MAG: hypothetical protein MSC30_11995 [Gaiellaceae bacterium MAG52_C11]|nr:hypothetical protein [Candidatus Gaiellasilicea maunaloa]
MSDWGVIPAIRVQDMAQALVFYLGPLEFTLDRGGDGESNSAIACGDARLMLETAADHYGDEYNAASGSGPLRRPPSLSRPPISPDVTPGSKQPGLGSSIRLPTARGDRRSSRSRIITATG